MNYTQMMVAVLSQSADVPISINYILNTDSTLWENLVSFYDCSAYGSFPDLHGTNNGTETDIIYEVDGTIGPVKVFNGSTSKISLGSNTEFDFINNFSISIWFKPDSLTGLQQKYLVSKGVNKYALLWGYVEGNVEFFASGYTGDNPRTNSGMTLVSGWNHIVYTYDGATLKGYLNDSLLVNESKSFTLSSDTSVLHIGSYTGTLAFIDGNIGPIYLSKTKTLSSDEVSELYNSGVPVQYNSYIADESILGTDGLSDNMACALEFKADGSVSDSHGTFNGTLVGPPTYISGGGYDFSGSGQYITLANPLKDQNDFTIEFVFNADNVTTAQRIFQLGDLDTDKSHYSCFLVGGIFYSRIFDNVANRDVTTPVSISTEYHVMMIYTNSTTTLECFVNNSSIGTVNVPNLTAWVNKSLYIGRRGNGDQQYNGKIKFINFTNEAFDSTKRSNAYNSGSYLPYKKTTEDSIVNHATLTDNMVACFPMDADGSSKDKRGTFNGTEINIVYSTDGPIRGSKDLNGSSAYIDTNISSSTLGSGNYSVALWFKADRTTGTNSLFSDWGSGNRSLVVWINGGNLQHYVASGSSTLSGNNSVAFTDTTSWHRVVATHDVSVKQLKLYLDGALVDTDTYTGTRGSSTNDFLIGSRPGGGDYYDGKIALTTVIKGKVWSLSEVEDDWNSGAGLRYE